MSGNVNLIKFILPWPPSVNKRLAHRRGQGRIYLSHYFKDYYKAAGAAIIDQLRYKNKIITEPVDQILTFHPPDNRRRDNDNYTKAVNDALKHAKIVEDDSLFRDCLTQWRAPVENGCVKVTLGKIKFSVGEI